jgi:hypothetical protein
LPFIVLYQKIGVESVTQAGGGELWHLARGWRLSQCRRLSQYGVNMPDNLDQLEVHRPALMGHCYRMLGSVVDAEDAAQESMIWRRKNHA